MEKAILVIDMPECCCSCDYCNEFGVCKYVGNVEDAFYRGLRYVKCPLRQLPEKKEVKIPNYVNDHEYECGWNDCLNEILGE